MKFRFGNGDQPLSGFTIKRGVGVGGFGEVYFATNAAGKEVALKQIQRNLDVEVRGVSAHAGVHPDHYLDMLAELQFTTLTEGQMFDVNPLLMDLPIPVRCVGSADAPTCRLVGDAAQRIVAKVLTSDENSALRAKIDEKIEEQVPEEYRDAARGLLDLLGGAIEKSTEEQ